MPGEPSPQGRVLVVDDSSTIIDWLVGVLAPEFHVETARSVSDALDALRLAKFDVVVTDYDLGDGTGLDLLSAATGGDSHATGILMTAHKEDEVVREAQRAGRVLVLFKPVEAAQLQGWVRNAVTMARLAATTRKISSGQFKMLEKKKKDGDPGKPSGPQA